MNLREKLLKIIVVIHGCASLLCFGDLPQKMIDDMKQALRDLKVKKIVIERTHIQEMSQEDIGEGHAGYTRFDKEGYPIISLDKNMFSNYNGQVKQLLINHALLREAVGVSYFSRVPLDCGKHANCFQYYWRENGGYQKYLISGKSLIKDSFAFCFASAASFWLVNNVRSSLGKRILGGLGLIFTVNLLKNLSKLWKNRKVKNNYNKTLRGMVRNQGNIINKLNSCIKYFDFFCHEVLKQPEQAYTNLSNEDKEKYKVILEDILKNSRAKCIQMRDEFLVNVGTLAVMSYKEPQSYKKYLSVIKDNQRETELISFPLLEQMIFTDKFIKNMNSEEDIMDNICLAGKNEGPYVNVINGYLKERILGLSEKNLRSHKGDIEKYIEAKVQGNIKEKKRGKKDFDSLLS